jgi:hypothetical protein
LTKLPLAHPASAVPSEETWFIIEGECSGFILLIDMSNSIKNFRIPSSFILFGHKYKVEFCDTLHEKEDAFGIADEDRKLIRLQPKGKVFTIAEVRDDADALQKTRVYFDITDECIVETFYHELMHIILDAIGEESLSKNEKLINMCGKALLEVYLSSTYEEDATLQKEAGP